MIRVTCILFKDDLFPPPVEFNKAARSLTDAVIPTTQKKTALNRLVKASTHVNVHQDLKYVKLWQVHTLLKGLEKIAASADIRMLVWFVGTLIQFQEVLLMHFLQWER